MRIRVGEDRFFPCDIKAAPPDPIKGSTHVELLFNAVHLLINGVIFVLIP